MNKIGHVNNRQRTVFTFNIKFNLIPINIQNHMEKKYKEKIICINF